MRIVLRKEKFLLRDAYMFHEINVHVIVGRETYGGRERERVKNNWYKGMF